MTYQIKDQELLNLCDLCKREYALKRGECGPSAFITQPSSIR